MSADAVLLVTAASLGFFHTLFGPDHYIPFIAMSKAGKWNFPKTIAITFVCGLGHILSSVILGFIGIALGLAVIRLTAIESLRGEIAGWFLLLFGFFYFLWGIYSAARHKHSHHRDNKGVMRLWIIFAIFVFGPCEPLIPLIMYPAAQGSFSGLVAVTAVFGITTISTMIAIVSLSFAGIRLVPMEKFERYNHAIAGAAILLCGIAIVFLGL